MAWELSSTRRGEAATSLVALSKVIDAMPSVAALGASLFLQQEEVDWCAASAMSLCSWKARIYNAPDCPCLRDGVPPRVLWPGPRPTTATATSWPTATSRRSRLPVEPD